MKKQTCKQCSNSFAPYWLKYGKCNGCRNPDLIVTAVTSKHTPGPWKCIPIDRAGNFSIIPPNAGNGTVVSTDEALANAKLIAAAPDMLEALKDVCDYLEGLQRKTKSMNTFERHGDMVRELEEVIAKAEGRDHE